MSGGLAVAIIIRGMEALLAKVREYLPPEKTELIEEALDYAARMHEGQTRRSGEPFIEHPISAAKYLAELSLDAQTIAAALLHDVVEDCGVTVQELRDRFGDDVASLVVVGGGLRRLRGYQADKAGPHPAGRDHAGGSHGRRPG